MFEKSAVSMLWSPSNTQDSFEDSQEVSEKSLGSKEPSASDEEAAPVSKRKRATNFSDSESYLCNEIKGIDDNVVPPSKSEYIIDDGSSSLHNITKKSRIKPIITSESENSSSEEKRKQKKSVRTEHKMKRLKDKFKGLISHQGKSSQRIDTDSNSKLLKSVNESSENSGGEVYSFDVKQKIQKSVYSMKSICDTDTSDEENNTKKMHRQKSKPKPKSTKPTSPKPMRMSAKQAMENMNKIKSESNRMLREKQVSLPYHRPKALSLKDILSRRKPAVASDGKALPIKMNNDQLKQYVLLLEQRQKEVIELCKSDTEEEEEDCSEDRDITTTDVGTELGLEANEGKIVKANNADLNKETNSSNAQENVVMSQNTEEFNLNSNSETNCIESNAEENIAMSQNVEELNDNSNKETSCINGNAEETVNYHLENQTESLLRTETINKPVIIDFDKESNEADINNSPRNNKEQELIIILQESSEKQSVNIPEQYTDRDSQNMELHYDSEKVELIQECEHSKSKSSEVPTTSIEKHQTETLQSDDDEFLDNDFNYDEIDKLIENAKIACDGAQKSVFNQNADFFSNPKLTGAPGMVIDLDNTDPLVPKQPSGVDLLKERFTYFAKLKSSEDMEKDREKKFKPGVQHLKLKQELEEQIAEQRSLEWEKRLEEEKRQKSEINGNFSDDDIIEKLESKLEDIDEKVDTDNSEGEEEPIENDVLLEDKPKHRNPMVDDEAEESEFDEEISVNNDDEKVQMDTGEADDGDEANLEDDDETSDSSSESEEEVETKPKKGRILKAFEDSDDESSGVKSASKNIEVNSEITENIINVEVSKKPVDNDAIKDSQDDELQLAQGHKSSDNLFSTQESDKPNVVVAALNKNCDDNVSADLGTQTFSILDSLGANHTVNLNSPEKTPVCRTQTLNDDLNLLIGVCPDKFSHNLINSQTTQPQFSQTQEFGDDVVALCTGKFYDNPFISQDDKLVKGYSPVKSILGSQSQEFGDEIVALCTGKFYDNPFVTQYGENSEINKSETLKTTQKDNYIEMVEKKDTAKTNNDAEVLLNSKNVEKSILNSILEELDGPDFEKPKNKYFPSENQFDDKINKEHNLEKKKLVIDSDDETNDGFSQKKKNKKLRKRKAEDRALQISDDEEEVDFVEDQSDVESNVNEDEERIVEYDSEENEVEVQQKISKKKHIGAFFENEAELTSEDEWVGSGDEDERGLDRMEREEGDDETFHQGQLQREIGQIHMREVLDQDKREVRMIQELLFEDGDLGDGHRQWKFRWRNADGDEEIGTNAGEFLDTQEEEFESEEQWRKQRHEREMFLRKLQEKDDTDLETSINRTAIIKANLCSKSMSTLLSETKGSEAEKDDTTSTQKKPVKDIPSPKKTFTIFQQNYHGSLLTRGRGALARLAALATPLATDNDDAPKNVTSTNRRNFVFTALSQDEKPKVTKRKADTNVNTPRLLKKMKTEDPNKHYKSTLFDHLKSC